MIPDHLVDLRNVRNGDDESFGIQEATRGIVRLSLKCTCDSRDFRLSGNDQEYTEAWGACARCGKASLIHSSYLHGWYAVQLKYDEHFADEYEERIKRASKASDLATFHCVNCGAHTFRVLVDLQFPDHDDDQIPVSEKQNAYEQIFAYVKCCNCEETRRWLHFENY